MNEMPILDTGDDTEIMSPRVSRDSSLIRQTRFETWHRSVSSATQCAKFGFRRVRAKMVAMATVRRGDQPVFNLCYNQHRELEAFGF